MTQNKLWDKLEQDVSKSFINDVKEGKVPDLPYYIIDQIDAKKKIESKIDSIKDGRFQSSILIANYGNGKTNILKYLKLFYKQKENEINVLYYPADSENFDIITNLLKIIEENYTDFIVKTIKELIDSGFEFKELANNFEDNFSAIEEYATKLFSSHDVEIIKNIFYLGTGRLSSKRYFDKEKLRQLRDYERRVVLVFFLNILAKGNKYVVFCIDEVEKISGKSKPRFSHFLTSLRELVDLSNKIRGHYLILAMTDKTDSTMIQATNEALYTRIHQDIIPIHPISEKKDKIELIEYLKELFKLDFASDVVLAKLTKESDVDSNRKLIQKISEIIFETEQKLNLDVLLKKYKLQESFITTKRDLEINVEAFKNIHRKFFDPLEYYLESFNIKTDDYFRSQLRYYYNVETGVLCYFIFSEDSSVFENEALKIKNIIDTLNLNKGVLVKDISFFVPSKMELNYSKINDVSFFNDFDVKIIDIEDFEDLFTLLELYRLYFDQQKEIKIIIENYTNSSL